MSTYSYGDIADLRMKAGGTLRAVLVSRPDGRDAWYVPKTGAYYFEGYNEQVGVKRVELVGNVLDNSSKSKPSFNLGEFVDAAEVTRLALLGLETLRQKQKPAAASGVWAMVTDTVQNAVKDYLADVKVDEPFAEPKATGAIVRVENARNYQRRSDGYWYRIDEVDSSYPLVWGDIAVLVTDVIWDGAR